MILIFGGRDQERETEIPRTDPLLVALVLVLLAGGEKGVGRRLDFRGRQKLSARRAQGAQQWLARKSFTR